MKILLMLCITFAMSEMQLLAYPTSINIIPTADVMDVGTVNIQLESDGEASLMHHDGELALYTQFGLTPRFEVGMDITDFIDESSSRLNAKWQLCSETKSRPALALGILDPTRDGIFSEWYLAASKDFGTLRMTSGYIDGGCHIRRGIFGFSHDVTNLGTITADWTTGTAGYHTLGIYRDLTSSIGILAYYARSNSYTEDDFLGLNVCWTVTLWAVEEKGN